jgi:hypothetical protein
MAEEVVLEAALETWIQRLTHKVDYGKYDTNRKFPSLGQFSIVFAHSPAEFCANDF